MKATDLINIAKAEIGTKEIPAGSNNVKYNTWYYGKSVSGAAYPWCAVFVSWCFKNNPHLCFKTASCLSMLQSFEALGQIVTTPQPGDIVFFKYSTNSRRTNHVGIVTEVNGNTIHTIEGNTSLTSNDNGGAVMARKRNKNIVAFARPKYDAGTTRRTIRFGSKGSDVKYLHQQLKKLKFGVNVDSDYFDSTTKLCVIYFQTTHDLVPDGVVGPRTWAEIEKV